MQALRPTRFIDAVPDPTALSRTPHAPHERRRIPAGLALVLALTATLALSVAASQVVAQLGLDRARPVTVPAGTLA